MMKKTKYCVHCGKEISVNVQYCPYCGAKQIPVKNKKFLNNKNHPEVNTYNIGSQRPKSSYNTNDLQSYFSNPFDKTNKRYIEPPQINPIQAFIRYWTHYFDFTGYSCRSEYWWWFLWECVINVVLWIAFVSTELNGMIGDILTGADTINFDGGPFTLIGSLSGFGLIGMLIVVWELVHICPNLALKVRRFRDAGLPLGWTVVLLVLNFIPVISFFSEIACFIISLLPSVRSKK